MIPFEPVLVHDWLRRTAERRPTHTAVIDNGHRYSYAEIDGLSERIAAHLVASGVRRGDRVVVFLDSSVETILAIYGILKAGGVFVVLEGSVKAPKLGYVMHNGDAVALVTHIGKAKVVAECANTTEHLQGTSIFWVGTSSPPAIAQCGGSSPWSRMTRSRPAPLRPALPRIIDIDLAALIYTSGSTGEPKGVMSTHRNMVAAARAIIQYVDNDPDDIILIPLPLSFDYGLYQVVMAFMFGGTVVLAQSSMYPETLLRTIEREGVSGLPIVPTLAAMLLRIRDIPAQRLASLRYITNTGAALPVEHIKRLRTLVPHARFYSMFGLTECKRVCFLPPHQIDHRPASVGMAMPNCEVLVVDPSGNPVQPGETGELVVRGANVMQGYWRAPEATRKVWRDGAYPDDRRLYAGDYFKTDHDGYLYFLGRRDDLIKSRGERISAREIENVLCALEGVAEAAVIGVPDALMGQAVRAFVVPSTGYTLAHPDILRHCRTNLESFMIPKYVDIVDTLPRTPHGKVDKKILPTQGVSHS